MIKKRELEAGAGLFFGLVACGLQPPITHQQSILSASRSIEFTFPFKLKFFIPKINSISLSERIRKVGGRKELTKKYIITVS